MQRALIVPVEDLSAEAFAPFGWILGKPFPSDPTACAYSHPGSDFWHEHIFIPGNGGETEVLWVNYRNKTLQLNALEVHWLTQQAIVPLGGEILHVVCPGVDGSRLPDLSRLKAFRIGDKQGICMAPGCWHASFVLEGQVTCLMLTRRSTTVDLVNHLIHGCQAEETSVVELGTLFDGQILLSPEK
ncbi:ureidoglycolate lyase [Pseudomonas sp.]|uniref:ureidoglycolate lyase n=1 Tax=Pseudomonas sp. TaxID=306 RepID=UPI00356B24C2